MWSDLSFLSPSLSLTHSHILPILVLLILSHLRLSCVGKNGFKATLTHTHTLWSFLLRSYVVVVVVVVVVVGVVVIVANDGVTLVLVDVANVVLFEVNNVAV